MLVAALTLAAFAVRLGGLLLTREPVGLDGYYYVVQAETWIATGHLHAPDSSWVLRFIALTVKAAGDPILGVKIAAASLAALCVPAAAFCAWANGRSRFVGAAWAAASPVIAHLCGDYPKNLGAAAPLIAFLGAVFAYQRDRRRRWLVLAAVAGIFAATAHKSALVLVVLIAAEAAALSVIGFEAAMLPVALGMIGLLLWGLFANTGDVGRLVDTWDKKPWPPVPFKYLDARPLPIVEAFELCAGYVAAFLLAVRKRPIPVSGAVVLALCPMWTPDPGDLGYRMMLFSSLVIVPAILPQTSERAARIAAGVLLSAAWPLEMQVRAHDITPPYAKYREVIEKIPRPELLIAHQGINFLYHHETQHEAMAWAPEPALDKTKIGRLVHGVMQKEWLAYLPDDVPPPLALPYGYSYWREDHFVRFVEAIRDNDDLRLRLRSALNPWRERPSYLMQRHER